MAMGSSQSGGLAQEDWIAVDRYVTGLLIPPDSILDATLQASDAAGLPAINVSPTQGSLLNILARIQGARRILESAPWAATAQSGWGARYPLAAAL